MACKQLKSTNVSISSELLKAITDEGTLIPEEFFSDRLRSADDQNEESAQLTADLLAELRNIRSTFNGALSTYGGVFLKLNNKAFVDMTSWVARLECKHFEDVLLCLKYSQIINDLIAKDQSGQFTLNFTEWTDIDPSSEFRCFFVNKRLTGVCQRKLSVFYPFLKSFGPTLPYVLMEQLAESVDVESDDFCVDVALKKTPETTLLLMSTDALSDSKLLLFTREELTPTTPADPVYKCIESEAEVRVEAYTNDYPLVS